MELKNKVEAVLFTLGKFVSLEDLGKYCEVGSIGLIKEALEELKRDYIGKNCSLEIQEHEGKVKLNIKKEYGYLTNKLLSNTELDSPTTKTLAIIAYKQPLMQSEVIKMRGNKAYDHIKALKESNLITSDKSGRTRVLKLTNNFYEYFDIAKEDTEKLMDFVNSRGLQKMFDENK